MRWLSVDLGARRIGFASSDDDEGPATLLRTVTIEPGGELDAILSAVREVGAEAVVLGLPLEMSGKEGLAARRARTLGKALARARPTLSIDWVDERMTTSEASRSLKASGKKRDALKGSVDQLAAKILLDTHLAMRAQRGPH